MKKKVLNNKGFAVSAILYTAVTLVVLILVLIISILSTVWKSKSLIVDDIKKNVSGIENKKSESLGDVIVTASDNKTSGEWHSSDFTLNFSKPMQNGTELTFPVTYYYGTSVNAINTKLSTNKITINTNTSGVNYYVRACRGTSKDICSKVGVYLVRLDKDNPTITVSGTSTTWSSSRTLTITPTSLSGISYYEYFVADSIDTPTENDEIHTFTENTITITELGQYILIRPVNTAGVKGTWNPYNLYVKASS